MVDFTARYTRHLLYAFLTMIVLVGASRSLGQAQQPASPASDTIASLSATMVDSEPGIVAVPVERPDTKTSNSSPPTTWLRWIESHGLTPTVAFTNDWSNLRGGACSDGSVNRYLLKSSLSLDTEKFFSLKGGTAFVSLYHHLGGEGGEYAGDSQGFSNIDAPSRTYLYELWYQQQIGTRVRVKLGKMDANTDFAIAENGADFLNSSMGYSPTIVNFATYPEPRPGINLATQLSEHYSVRVGAYDTAGPGAMSIVEGTRTWTIGSRELKGRIAVGWWRQTGTIECFDGDKDSGTNGIYLVAEHDVWRASKDRRSLSVFMQYGHSDGEISDITRHLGGGMVLHGLLARRPDDAVGFGPTWVRFSEEPAAGYQTKDEIALEAFYKLHINRFISVLPDVQFIHNPGGLLTQPNAVTFTPRVTVTF